MSPLIPIIDTYPLQKFDFYELFAAALHATFIFHDFQCVGSSPEHPTSPSRSLPSSWRDVDHFSFVMASSKFPYALHCSLSFSNDLVILIVSVVPLPNQKEVPESFERSLKISNFFSKKDPLIKNVKESSFMSVFNSIISHFKATGSGENKSVSITAPLEHKHITIKNPKRDKLKKETAEERWKREKATAKMDRAPAGEIGEWREVVQKEEEDEPHEEEIDISQEIKEETFRSVITPTTAVPSGLFKRRSSSGRGKKKRV
ncbi:hypothetical protein P9112_013057 [Eukaryota sp. TZLM1-RC]